MGKHFAMKLLSLIVLVAGVVAAQSAPPRKDIPAIAKAANGAIVTIIMAVNDKPIAQGTGFLVRPDGVIVTNYHVIQTGDVAVVKFPDGTVLQVDGVLSADKVRDLAIIKIHGKAFRTLTLGNSDQIQVGEEVVAIGNPLSLESTVSNGIVSGMRTSKEQGGKFLQTSNEQVRANIPPLQLGWIASREEAIEHGNQRVQKGIRRPIEDLRLSR